MAWTVHLQHEGQPLVFLLDVFEVPEVCLHMRALFDFNLDSQSHTGEVLAREFDSMLERFGLQHKVPHSSDPNCLSAFTGALRSLAGQATTQL